jgi:hypothetical protein
MLGVIGDVVPPVPLVSVGGIGRVAVLLLLGDEGPLLVELDLTGARGKKPDRPGVWGGVISCTQAQMMGK